MARQSAPQKLLAPIFLAARVKASPGTILVDVHDPARYIEATAAGMVWRQGRPPGMRTVKGAEPLTLPRSGGFDWLYSGHRALFKPNYGDPEDAYEVFRAWAFCHIMRAFLPVRPIAVFTGTPGAAKTTTASSVAQLWYGMEAPTTMPMHVPESLKDFVGAAARSPMVLVDNVESPSKWLADTLCVIASSDGKLSMRELYTTAGCLDVRPDTFLAVTSFSARGFTRGDLLSRSIIFPMQPPAQDVGYVSKATWSLRVEKARTGFWREALEALKVVLQRHAALMAGDEHLPAPAVPAAFDRLQDFAWVGEAICEHFAGQEGKEQFQRGMAAIAMTRITLAANDPEIESLIPVGSLPDAATTWYTSTDLLRTCATLQNAERGYDLTSRSVEAFGRWLTGVCTKGPGVMNIDQKFLHGRKLWRIQLPPWVQAASNRLRIPASTNPQDVQQAAQLPPGSTNGSDPDPDTGI